MGDYVKVDDNSDHEASLRLKKQMPILIGLLAIQFACYVPISLAGKSIMMNLSVLFMSHVSSNHVCYHLFEVRI